MHGSGSLWESWVDVEVLGGSGGHWGKWGVWQSWEKWVVFREGVWGSQEEMGSRKSGI